MFDTLLVFVGVPERIFLKKVNFEKKSADNNKCMKIYPVFNLPENVVCLFCLLHIFKCASDNF